MRYLYNRNINILIKFLQIIMNRVKGLLTLFMFDNHKIVEKIIIDPNNYFLTKIPDCNYVRNFLTI